MPSSFSPNYMCKTLAKPGEWKWRGNTTSGAMSAIAMFHQLSGFKCRRTSMILDWLAEQQARTRFLL